MSSRLTDHRTGVVLAAGGMLLVSLDSLGIRLTESSSWDIAFWFGAFTALAMTVVIPLRTGRSLVKGVIHDGWAVVVSGVLQAASTVFFIFAINSTTVANAVVIVAAAPIIAALMSRYAIGERTTPRVWTAIGLSIIGILVVVSGSIGGGRLSGDLAAVAAITSFAANLTLWRRYSGQSRMVAIGLGGAMMALVSAIPANPFDITWRALLILAFLGGVAGPAGRIAIASATRYLPTSQVSLFTPVETVAATAWAWIFLSETPPGLTFIGGTIVLGAVAFGSAATANLPTIEAD